MTASAAAADVLQHCTKLLPNRSKESGKIQSQCFGSSRSQNNKSNVETTSLTAEHYLSTLA